MGIGVNECLEGKNVRLTGCKLVWLLEEAPGCLMEDCWEVKKGGEERER